MKKSDFDFDAGTVEVRDANEKTRRGAVLPLRKSTAEEIKQFLSNKTPEATAFMLKKGSMMMKLDLKAAGIPYQVDGRFADFHSLRHSTATLLIQTGANVKTIQTLMRHSTPDLTLSKYTHLYAGQQRETVENLPDFILQNNKAIMTGTYDSIEENQGKKNCPKIDHQSVKNRTIPNNSYVIKTTRNNGFNALNRRKTAF